METATAEDLYLNAEKASMTAILELENDSEFSSVENLLANGILAAREPEEDLEEDQEDDEEEEDEEEDDDEEDEDEEDLDEEDEEDDDLDEEEEDSGEDKVTT